MPVVSRIAITLYPKAYGVLLISCMLLRVGSHSSVNRSFKHPAATDHGLLAIPGTKPTSMVAGGASASPSHG